ncbi:MAG: acyl-CoA thioesterase [Paludibacteraceae bacterium]|nr:acyl-CoA thioesterase [Paludibacteraceae bacterium]MBN2787196.1 acyl-CoA thioesterase [Paludibacteraceae bacterium]
MCEYEFSVRVRYSETDVMGYVHHSNYARYYETARWELFRKLGVPYKHIEDEGYMLPVVSMNFKFIKAAVYDELLVIKTKIKCVNSPRITFSYRMYNEQNEIINKAEVNLAFIDKKTRTICTIPFFVKDAIANAVLN